MRQLATEVGGNDLAHEMVPFLFSKEGTTVFRDAPFVYVPNIIATVSDRLAAQER